jgi:hypothetical protein
VLSVFKITVCGTVDTGFKLTSIRSATSHIYPLSNSELRAGMTKSVLPHPLAKMLWVKRSLAGEAENFSHAL